MKRFWILISYALRDASKSRLILVLIILSLSAAFASVFSSTSVLLGFKTILEEGAINASSDLVIRPISNELVIKNIDEVIKKLKRIPQIEAISVRSRAIVGIEYEDRLVSPFTAFGANVKNENNASEIPHKMMDGLYLNSNKSKEVVIGRVLADALKGPSSYDKTLVRIGEELKITSLKGRTKTYQIRGIFDAKSFAANFTIFFNKEELEQLDSDNKNSEIIIKLKNSEASDLVKESIQKVLPSLKIYNWRQESGYITGIRIKEIIQKILPDLKTYNWRQESGYIDDIISAIELVTNLINRLLLASTFIIISAVVYINVMHKRRLIGVMKAMGATNKFIMGIYIIETLTYVLLSYIMGFLIFIAINIYSFNNPVPLIIGDFIMIFDINAMWASMLISFIAALGGSIIPAYIASKTNIIDVMRGNI